MRCVRGRRHQRRLLSSVVLLILLAASACGRRAPSARVHAPLPQVDGTLPLPGLQQPVTVVRDRWGIAHITAQNEHDLFYAQGFVQAQDRLFQMDLWRKASLGRLAQALGPNFIDRDVMTARVQYRGDVDVDWASYGQGAARIADAFVAGVNAWVFRARAHLPDEFILAGWIPDLWNKDDLLNRTDAFLSSGDAELESFRAQLIAEVGQRRADALLPSMASRASWPVADLAAAGRAVGEALRRAGAPPYFAGFAAPFAGSNAWVIPARRSTSGAPLLAADPHRPLTVPALRYLVHLRAPGWNVIGATSPWLPGVAIGHNESVAWGMAAHPANTETISVEHIDPADPQAVDTVKEQLFVKNEGRFVFERQTTRHGVVIATDHEHHLVFTLDWAGFHPGSAAELGALTLDQAKSLPVLRAAIANWNMPVVDVVYADRLMVGQMTSGASVSRGSSPANPVPLAANGDVPRTNRLRELLAGTRTFTIDDLKQQQHDVLSWNAAQLLTRLSALRASDPDVENARRQLVAWDRRVTFDSAPGALYVLWERELRTRLAEQRLPRTLVDAYLRHVPFDVSEALKATNAVLLDALSVAVQNASADPENGRSHPLFQHPLAIARAARGRFNVGPFTLGGYESTVMPFSRQRDMDIGPSFREILNPANWDSSVAINAPGQSEWTNSPHYSDLAKLWAAGEYFPLSFSEHAIQENADTTLVLRPIK